MIGLLGRGRLGTAVAWHCPFSFLAGPPASWSVDPAADSGLVNNSKISLQYPSLFWQNKAQVFKTAAAFRYSEKNKSIAIQSREGESNQILGRPGR